jgi:hypothetical protein
MSDELSKEKRSDEDQGMESDQGSRRVKILRIMLKDNSLLDRELGIKLGRKKTSYFDDAIKKIQEQGYITHENDLVFTDRKRTTLIDDKFILTKLYHDDEYLILQPDIRKYHSAKFFGYLQSEFNQDIFRKIQEMLILSHNFFEIVMEYGTFHDLHSSYRHYYPPFDNLGILDTKYRKSWLMYQLFAESIVKDELDKEQRELADLLLKELNGLITTEYKNSSEIKKYLEIIDAVQDSLRFCNKENERKELEGYCKEFIWIFDREFKDKEVDNEIYLDLWTKFHDISRLIESLRPQSGKTY